ncbi:K+ channel tetramerization subfamily protein [Pelomyxa schiedti]|nr:K+ channel tetramerization subfamily protein [Pelomyxa schiedti]
MSSDIVRLNVGGRLFVTSVATLTCRGSSFFTGLLSGRMPSVRDESGAYFIDRSADCFAPILEFMRTGKLRLPPGMEASAIQDEADFYQVTLPRATTATYGWVHLKSNYQNSYTYAHNEREHQQHRDQQPRRREWGGARGLRPGHRPDHDLRGLLAAGAALAPAPAAPGQRLPAAPGARPRAPPRPRPRGPAGAGAGHAGPGVRGRAGGGGPAGLPRGGGVGLCPRGGAGGEHPGGVHKVRGGGRAQGALGLCGSGEGPAGGEESM